MIRVLLCVLLLAGCYEDAPDGNGLVVELSDQPPTADFGVLLSVHARGGDSVAVDVEAGSLFLAGAASGTQGATNVCLLNVSGTPAFSAELAVTPDHESALLSATLFPSEACNGPGIQSRLMLVQKPTVSNVVDAGTGDAQ